MNAVPGGRLLLTEMIGTPPRCRLASSGVAAVIGIAFVDVRRLERGEAHQVRVDGLGLGGEAVVLVGLGLVERRAGLGRRGHEGRHARDLGGAGVLETR